MSSRSRETPSTDNCLGLRYYHEIGQLAPAGYSFPMLEWLGLFKQLPQLSDIELQEFLEFMVFLQSQLNKKYEVGSFLHTIYQIDPQRIVREIDVSSIAIRNIIINMFDTLKQTTEQEFTAEFQNGINRFLSDQIALLKRVYQ